MRVLLQRVKQASVTSGDYYANIKFGLLLFVGITHQDTLKEVNFLADKCANLRVFNDKQGKMNLSLLEVGGEVLVVSQFTLYGDARKGRRPNYIEASSPDHARDLISSFVTQLKELGLSVKEGCFGENMDIELINDGPVTLMLEQG